MRSVSSGSFPLAQINRCESPVADMTLRRCRLRRVSKFIRENTHTLIVWVFFCPLDNQSRREYHWCMIKYTQATSASRPTCRTIRYGNLLSDTYQGEVHQSADGTWTGWVYNWSSNGRSEFRFDFASRAAAARWTNARLRARGIK